MRRRASGPRFGANNMPRANPTAPPANALYTPTRVMRFRGSFFMNDRRAGQEEYAVDAPSLYRTNRIRFLWSDPFYKTHPAGPVRLSLLRIFAVFSAPTAPHSRGKMNPSVCWALNVTDLVRFLQEAFGNLHGLCLCAPGRPPRVLRSDNRMLVPMWTRAASLCRRTPFRRNAPSGVGSATAPLSPLNRPVLPDDEFTYARNPIPHSRDRSVPVQ